MHCVAEELRKGDIGKGSLSKESSSERRTWDSDGAHILLGSEGDSEGDSEMMAFHSREWERLG